MNRFDVQRLQSMRGYPFLSLLLPTHRTVPANLQDPIRVRNLVKEATQVWPWQRISTTRLVWMQVACC